MILTFFDPRGGWKWGGGETGDGGAGGGNQRVTCRFIMIYQTQLDAGHEGSIPLSEQPPCVLQLLQKGMITCVIRVL